MLAERLKCPRRVALMFYLPDNPIAKHIARGSSPLPNIGFSRNCLAARMSGSHGSRRLVHTSTRGGAERRRRFVERTKSDFDVIGVQIKKSRSALWAKASVFERPHLAGHFKIIRSPLRVGDEEAAAFFPAIRAGAETVMKRFAFDRVADGPLKTTSSPDSGNLNHRCRTSAGGEGFSSAPARSF
jgi:hypothetical protein